MSNGADRSRTRQTHYEQSQYAMRPDYTKPILEVPAESRAEVQRHLEFLYGPDLAAKWLPEFIRVIKVHHAHKPPARLARESMASPERLFSERDLVLITYADMFRDGGEVPLRTLMRLCSNLMEAPNTLHILPFFPYSSDRGFSVIDYTQVDSNLGDWSDIRQLAGSFKLMFDGVLNHVSSRSRLFQDFLDGRPDTQDFFIAYNSPEDLTADQRSKIFRPRTSDILSRFNTINGVRYLWTTFSEDQIDLNYRNPEVLLEATEALLLYVRMGADLLRLDAVTYVWAEPGTECVHLDETHEIVKLLRTVMDIAAPGTALITETNVPHEDNISYFGNGRDEAHMVYNFALPPMVLYTFFAQDSRPISKWAAGLEPPSDQTHFFNILDTHDGIGLQGARDILDKEQIGLIVSKANHNGALISYKAVEGGGQEPYEINATWWSVLIDDDLGGDMDILVQRYVASRSISLALRGVPAIYVHGALATENDWETYNRTKHPRDLNRAYLDAEYMQQEFANPSEKSRLLLERLRPLHVNRVRRKAFHPSGTQRVLLLHPGVFIVMRTSPSGEERILALTSVSKGHCTVHASLKDLDGVGGWRDILSERQFQAEGDKLTLTLKPYEVLWLEPDR